MQLRLAPLRPAGRRHRAGAAAAAVVLVAGGPIAFRYDHTTHLVTIVSG